MSSRDQAIFLDAFLGIQRARKRRAYDSDSDSSIDQSTNRGNKLKRRARLVHEGRLDAADGLSVFAEPVEHAGYHREIVHRNAPLVDADGYEINSDDDDDVIQEAEAAAADQNPYAEIHLEHLLAPLTAVTDLPTHPTLAHPFTSKALGELAEQGCSWMHKENAALWAVKPLLTKLCGDHVWVDCSLLVTPDDVDLFDDGFVARLAAAAAAAAAAAQNNGASDTAMVHAATPDKPVVPNGGEPHSNGSRRGSQIKPDDGVNGSVNGDTNGVVAIVVNGDAHSDADADSDDDGSGFIHPLFLAPRAARAEPDVGLPEAEAEDVRRLLQLWVQKQEEVARGTRTLHEGLLRAERLRKTVFGWAKAEAHSGPNRGDELSDGEDWYDGEEWGLTEALKKGHDEEEEDLQQPHKKTRNRK